MINLNSAFEDELYFNYLKDPDSVSPEWREYFQRVHGKSVFVVDDRPVPATENYGRSEATVRMQNISTAGSPLDFITDWSDFTPDETSHIKEMYQSLDVPSASSTRTMAVKALDENRRIINRYHLKLRKPRVSFTHLVAWSVLKSLIKFPRLNDSFDIRNGKPVRIIKNEINVGLAIDLVTPSGKKILVIPSIKNAQNLSFYEFMLEFDEMLFKARNGKLEYRDLSDTTITLINPGMIGTTMSNPRLLKGQGLVVSAGLIDYPTEFQAVRPDVLTKLAVSKVVTITNTYDHRIIQGAESAEFLAFMNRLLLGDDQFYEQIFYSLKIPFEPIKWQKDFSSEKFSFIPGNDDIEKGAHVMQMINAYRVRGHLLAHVNPLGFETYYYPELDPAYYGFTIWDLDRIFHADDSWENNNMPLRDIIELLRETYCGSTGIEFMHIQSPEIKDWIKKKLESTRNTIEYTQEEKIQIMRKLVDAEVFENYLHTKFVGHKRFSLEGGEAFIILLDKILQESADNEINTVIIGMAHRGRLNVLANNIGKSYAKMFNEFEGHIDEDSYQGSGDVKYHLGDRGTYTSLSDNRCYVLLSPNPSHLELVDPVVEGMARALENEIGDRTYYKALPVLVHGDAAFAGQGIIAETLNLSQLDGYKTGGTIHIIINNQIGFTTSAESSRSTIYATDIAKMIQSPIIHVNGNDPEAVRSAAAFAFQFRSKFKSDVIIDMLCYRKYGHNEADEPTYTQPLLYKKIKQMTNVAKIYEDQLLKENVVTQDEIDHYYTQLREKLDDAFARRKEKTVGVGLKIQDKSKMVFENFDTKVPEDTIKEIGIALSRHPEDFILNPKIKNLLKKREEMINSEKPLIDWAMGELLAFGSMLIDKTEVRISGQDTRRGTFSQRHAVYTDFVREYDYIPLNHISRNQSVLRIFDSPLSEMAVLGFEYGYSVVSRDGITLWEAQFGDFANNAQTVVDQYIACSEVKWGQTSNLVLLLPHGYDGQGPEHSSARLERYLQLCAENNMFVCNFTTPANYFHALRRQIIMPAKIPMIVMTPKGMLRHPMAVSAVADFTDGHFRHLIDDEHITDKSKVRRVLLTTGKLYYEILQERIKRNIDDIAIIRIEQIYPFHTELFFDILKSYSNTTEICWVQEEPKNQGAWSFLFGIFHDILGKDFAKLRYIGRKASAATATGISKIHFKEQDKIIDTALS
ncbi:MAG: multifunctional oxoglutarate decarboxylase/oxoglutarate dehydrogenase thiamine pyrophosphate-binding subunit/dihydrolipoyllysine-residue succinyltransferase subunit [Candidatus Kapabacteria bacterium]|nr:multifunctional oxoglutarate decarboxylase/oxoglutarate dehydrogenase thiamine pyrophosphate-binding subunit/dihydrolipoyllysine-residue succinyltransferase subunit [Ignavibacteriota bacterium]MCW5884105.1 multifunctional oxoglutarate decarboxylase/oxoglutarate dehydrogenase thiamine pyrophosphate-binding subunit/dihydrolipoyllysine-residue succinyltransferase subunit [Candidatus Kapabacteria bacterium]